MRKSAVRVWAGSGDHRPARAGPRLRADARRNARPGRRQRSARERFDALRSGGSATTARAAQPWPECLRGAIAEGFSAVVYEGGSVEDLAVCARSRGVAALYVLHGADWLSYFPGAPEFVNREFTALLSAGLPAMSPLIVKRASPGRVG